MTKRFRDNTGKLTMSLADLRKTTKEEAKSYYIPGKIYFNNVDSKEYIYLLPSETDGELAHFRSFDNYDLFYQQIILALSCQMLRVQATN